MFREYCPECMRDVEFIIGKKKYFCRSCNVYWESDEIIKKESKSNFNVPEGCKACGGPYPSCKTSCKIFDD